MTTHTPPLCGDNLRVLHLFRHSRWSIKSYDLKWALHMLRVSARISELRHRYGINIVATWKMDNGHRHTTFVIPNADRPHARAVLLAALAAERAKQNGKAKI